MHTTIPLFFLNFTKTEQNKMSKAFEIAQEQAKAQTIQNLKIYAKSLFEIPARVKYKTEHKHIL